MGEVIKIKNMVCQRCIVVVEQILDKIKLTAQSIELGEVQLKDQIVSSSQLNQLDQMLVDQGFERISDEKSQLLEELKTLIISTIHHEDQFVLDINWSSYLSEKLRKDYNSLSGLFSSIEGITLEQYIIKQKIERVKEYLIYNQLSLKEIAFKLGYSSVAHLSAQFKKQTGFTPSRFKEIRPSASRKPLDDVK